MTVSTALQTAVPRTVSTVCCQLLRPKYIHMPTRPSRTRSACTERSLRRSKSF